MRRRTALFVAPIAAIALIGAGCGGGDSTTGTTGNQTTDVSTGSSGGDAVSILNGIKIPDTQDAPTKVVFKVNADLKGKISDPQAAAFLGDGPISIELSGPTDPSKKSADVAFDLKAGKLNFKGNVRVIDGTKAFLQLNDKWYELPADSINQTTGTENADLSKITEALKSVDAADLLKNPEVKGSENIEGSDTHHIAGDVDTAGLVKAAAEIAKSQGDGPSASEIAEAETKLAEYVKNAKVDVWVGKDDQMVKRIQIRGDFVTDADMKSQSGLDGAAIDLTVQATPTDSPNVEVPSGALTQQQLQQDLTGILLQAMGGATP